MQGVLAPIWDDIARAFTTWQFDLAIIAALLVALTLNRFLPKSRRPGFPTDLVISVGVAVAIGWAVLVTITDHTSQVAYTHVMTWVSILAVAAVFIVWIVRALTAREAEASPHRVAAPSGSMPPADATMLLQFVLGRLERAEKERDDARQKLRGPPWQDLMAGATGEAALSGEIDALRQHLDATTQQRDAAQQQRDAVQQQRDDLQRELTAAKAIREPKLIVSIKRVAVDTRGGGFTVLVVATVSSENGAVTACNWDVSVTVFKKAYVGEPIHVRDGDSVREGRIDDDGSGIRVLKSFARHPAETALPAITLSPVAPGLPAQGFYLVNFGKLGAANATLLETLLLTYTDHNRQRVDVPITPETEVVFDANLAIGPPW